ncbi:4-hydroxybenzoate octaprenyltransferase protein [Salinisphaera shabanensis E1L3A]|uniref:4-hydroxybenzoate octaprenyltransferase n=1 Tax=Salinisphaera shabanensis E1L3A TaxID=1033802 RepID=U2FWM5_9GAMM|nr:4-hydroxybenzoate octaprenyltransferase [Salinisphaera shabanensis]ERJ18648.1 4-hydroxybenzoate octaprenyltransferase protein [Salinisphaera shabanensis E1L3A]
MSTARLNAGHFDALFRLTRLHKPIGIFLVVWPMLWALWLAAGGVPDLWVLSVFVLGAILMRSAGCVINDFADRKIDGHVKRTKARPLATGEVSSREALVLFAALCLTAFALVLTLNGLTIAMSFVGAGLAVLYPFTKRHTHWPQMFLGAAFGWAVPMAFAAQAHGVPLGGWLLFAATLIWALVYDTFYAMVDRDDDLKIGVKSTAILWGRYDRAVIGVFQLLFFALLIGVGRAFELGWLYYLGLVGGALMAIYHQWLARHRDRDACFRVFMQHNVLGGIIFAGVVADLAIR